MLMFPVNDFKLDGPVFHSNALQTMNFTAVITTDVDKQWSAQTHTEDESEKDK